MQKELWNFIEDGENPGAFNMRFDEHLVEELVAGKGPPTLRLYQWKPWAISLGFHQSISDIDVQRCKEQGIDVVRRPTGGRAILHARELTYSVVMHTCSRSISEVYNEISCALVEGLKVFGVTEVTLQRTQPDFGDLYKNPSSVSCFSSSARHEIEYKGRKLVGSAQRRYRTESAEVVLQHGSILCGPEHRRLSEFLVLKNEQVRTMIDRKLEEKTVNLHSIVGEAMDVRELSACIRKGFEHAFGITFAECATRRNLAGEVYG